MIGTTHFANALVERTRLDRVGILRLASPSGEALPPLTGWPDALSACIGRNIFLLPGGYEVDGREIAAVRRGEGPRRRADLARPAASTRSRSPAPSRRSTRRWRNARSQIVRAEHPRAVVTPSHVIGRIGFIERENAAILNAALSSLAATVMTSFERALAEIGVHAPLYISQNDGTLISAAQAAAYPVLTIGSGPTNSMRGAAFLTGVQDAIVMDVGGTTTDIGVLAAGFPRESVDRGRHRRRADQLPHARHPVDRPRRRHAHPSRSSALRRGAAERRPVSGGPGFGRFPDRSRSDAVRREHAHRERCRGGGREGELRRSVARVRARARGRGRASSPLPGDARGRRRPDEDQRAARRRCSRSAAAIS